MSLKRHFEKRIARAKRLREKHGLINMIMKPEPPESREKGDDGRELLTVGAAMWLRCFCNTLMKLGVAREAYFEGDPVNLWLRNAKGVLSFAEIPNEAINNRDYDWILRRFMERPAAKHLISLEREMYGR